MRKKKKVKISTKYLVWLPLVLGIVILVGSIILKMNGVFEKGKTTIITKSTLIDTVDIAELSTAEFTYNGIAEIPENKKSDKIKCRVRYKAKVKDSVNMEDIDFDIDDANKTVKPNLPEIELEAIIDDQEGFSFIPEKSTVDLQEVIKVCKKDVTVEAEQASELYDSAEENLKDIVQALTYPVIKSKGYKLIWK